MKRMAVVLAGLLFLSTPLVAQGSDRTPILDLLARARSALFDLRYDLADSLARDVLLLDQRLKRTDRIKALQIAAAARFPEETPAQQPDTAAGYLRELVRLAPAAEIPADITWDGLNAMLENVRITTFGAAATPDLEYHVTMRDPVSIDVVASRRARFVAYLRAAGASQFTRVAEAGPGMRGTLRIRWVDAGGPRIHSGSHELLIVARDDQSLDSLTLRYAVTVDAPPLELVPVPAAIDSADLLPEKTKPGRIRGILTGALLGVGTAVAAGAFRDPDLRNGAAADDRAVRLGAFMGIGSIAGAFLLDHGTALPANIRHNRELYGAHRKAVGDAMAENERRHQAYAMTVAVEQED